MSELLHASTSTLLSFCSLPLALLRSPVLVRTSTVTLAGERATARFALVLARDVCEAAGELEAGAHADPDTGVSTLEV